jgi:DNA-binding transcriptional LysR family regulator
VEIRQVRYFLAVAELRNFARASEQLHVVQPAVSQQIRRLEHELGARLFHRTTRTVELTPMGIEFLKHAREIVAAVDRARDVVQRKGQGPCALRVGTGSGLGTLIGDALQELSRHRPGLTVELVRLPEQQRLLRLAEGKLAAAIVREASQPLCDGLERTPVFRENLIAALPAVRTTVRRSTVRLEELAAMPARLPERDQNPVLLDALSCACQSIGVTLSTIPAGADEDMLALIAAGLPSWTVFYPQKAQILARRSLRGVALRRIVAPAVSVTTSIVTRTDSPEARAFVDAFRTIATMNAGPSKGPARSSPGWRPTTLGYRQSQK